MAISFIRRFRDDKKLFLKLFYPVNTIYFLLGCANIGVFFWMFNTNFNNSVLTPTSYSNLSTAGVCFAIGAITILNAAVVGLVGVVYKVKMLILLYGCVLILQFFVHTVCTILSHFYEGPVRETLKHILISTVNRTNVAKEYPINHISITWDEMQASLHCCGVNGYSDWFHSVRWRHNNFVPDSCCDYQHFNNDESMLNCGKTNDSALWYQEGCFEPYTDWLLKHTFVLNLTAFVCLTVEAILLFLAYHVYRYLKSLESPTRTFAQYRASQDGETEGMISISAGSAQR
uniref:Tetraspanin n=1 Tax=Panagrellus redivivus TaxID=6233 RepID=A0A7E4ZVJ6_PANRE